MILTYTASVGGVLFSIAENELNSFCSNNFQLSFSQELTGRTGCHEIVFVKRKFEIDRAHFSIRCLLYKNKGTNDELIR